MTDPYEPQLRRHAIYSHEFKFYVDSGDSWSDYTDTHSDGMTAKFNADVDHAALTVARLVAERDEALKKAENRCAVVERQERYIQRLLKEIDALRKVLRKPKKRLEDGPDYRWAVMDSRRIAWLMLNPYNNRYGFLATKNQRDVFLTKAQARLALANRNASVSSTVKEKGIFVRIRVKS